MKLKMSTNDVFATLCSIAQSATAPLFTAYRSDLYQHDRDALTEDAQPGDTWLWVLKMCGTWLALVEEDSSFLNAIIASSGGGERFFLIEIGADGRSGCIEEIPEDQLATRLGAIRTNPNRKPRRHYLSTLLQMTFGSQLRDTIAMTDMGEISSRPWQTAYFNAQQNRLRYIIGSTSKDRVLAFHDPIETQGCFRVTITSARGHARIEPIDIRQFGDAARRVRIALGAAEAA